MSKVGISTACFYPGDTFASLCEVLDTGVEIAEIFMNSLDEISPDNLRKFKAELSAHGTEVVSFHPYTSAFESLWFFSEYTRRVNDGIEVYKRFFEAAAFFEAKYFVFHGEKASPTFSRGLARDEILAESYSRLIECAKSFGVTFTQENVNNFRSQDASHIKHLSEILPELRFTFDLKQALRAKREPEEIIRAMAKDGKLLHIHINDFGETECCLPFKGSVDLPAIKKVLDDVGYSGNYILEVYRTNFTGKDDLKCAADKVKELFCS